MSGCGVGEEGGAEVGTAGGGERQLEKDNIGIAAGASRALCLCRILSRCLSVRLSHLHSSVSIYVCL